MAARRLLGQTSPTACVGSQFELDGACVVPLPHPSGASGWLNAPANRERLDRALGIVREQLVLIGC
jgi:uracil-DNA glycosylase